jgi:diguanylate cyclase (GGDEF)-like protein
MDSGRDLLLEFLDLLNSAMHIEKLIQISCDFFYSKFKLNNCSIFYGEMRHAQNVLSPEIIAVWSVVEKHVLESNSFILISDPNKEMILQGIEGREKIGSSMLAFPISSKNKAEGACIFYSNENLSSYVELISVMLSKLSTAVSRAQSFEDAKHYAITDVLTGLYNKAYFAEALKNEVARGQRNQRPISLIMLDFDNFKVFNDTKGHIEGDVLLKETGQLIRESIRALDIPCRYGGEEFTVILPETSHDSAYDVSERIRKKVEECGKTKISLGVVTCMNSSVSPDTLLKETDKALYKAKSLGKNRTVNLVIVPGSDWKNSLTTFRLLSLRHLCGLECVLFRQFFFSLRQLP